MTLLQLAGMAVLVAALSFVLRGLSSRLGAAVPLLGGLALLTYALSRYVEPVRLILDVAEQGGIGEATSAILRMLGVGMLAAITADLCRDLGESTLAGRVELCGKIEILLLTLPFVSELLSLALGVWQ